MRAMGALATGLALLTPSRASAREASHPVLSLVIAGTLRVGGIVPLQNDTGCGDTECPEEWPLASFDRAETLYGRPVPGTFRAEMRSWRSYAGPPLGQLPAVLVVEHLPGGESHVIAFRFSDRIACLSREDLRWPGWHPRGARIEQHQGGICVDVRHLARKP